MKPRSANTWSGKPQQKPEHNHAVLSQAEQARHLGVGDETVMNLGHRVREDDLTRHPLGKVQDYHNHASEHVVRGPARGVGVYRGFKNPESGLPSEQNLSRWSDYAKSNSYTGHHHKDGPGVEPPPGEPRRSVPSEAHGKDSDGHLAPLPKPSTDNWANYSAGSDSGEGRLQKIGKR
jgi:hypothetical protein